MLGADHSRDLDRDWCVAFLRRLPAELRTGDKDPLLVKAARQARKNGWDAATLAAAVAGKDYSGVLNPPLLAVNRLEELGQVPPPSSPPAAGVRGARRSEAHCGRGDCECSHTHGCYKGWLDGPPGAQVVHPCPNCRPNLGRWARS